jgi:peptidoglycan-N-acetylglucosamine deacetylase
MAKEILCAFGVDVDAVGGWLGSYGGEDSPCDISRGMFSGEVGSLRLLKLFDRWGIKTTWFIPGHSIETFPEQMQAVADAGHEIGMHGYSHENPIAMTREQEEAVMDKSIALITRLSGKKPRGFVAPWWEFSPVSNELLLQKGIKYDHSLMHNDFTPYYVRVGDSWTKIDYSKKAQEWMKPLVRGRETDLIEIPASWLLDDLPPMMFMKAAPNSHGFVNPRQLEEMWRDQFDWVYREMDYGVVTFTIHPDVSGKPGVLLMLERLYEHVVRHPGVKFLTFEQIADDFARRFPRKAAPKAAAKAAPAKAVAKAAPAKSAASKSKAAPKVAAGKKKK